MATKVTFAQMVSHAEGLEQRILHIEGNVVAGIGNLLAKLDILLNNHDELKTEVLKAVNDTAVIMSDIKNHNVPAVITDVPTVIDDYGDVIKSVHTLVREIHTRVIGR